MQGPRFELKWKGEHELSGLLEVKVSFARAQSRECENTSLADILP